ncbi:hypothetical protein [Qipengyuania citrea]|nr:hypothetical protein [Qipengyuania citrea]MCP2016863.1 hypothetical protein [Qipengyuania citrea]
MHVEDTAWPPRWSAASARRRRRFDWLALAPALFLAAYGAAAIGEAFAR